MTLKKHWLSVMVFVIALGGVCGNLISAAEKRTSQLSKKKSLPEKKSPQLNVIVLLIDDLGWVDLSCQGSTFYETPNIDRLAKQGMRFTAGYSACAVCSPTRCCYLTGKYPHRLGTTNTIDGGKAKSKYTKNGVQLPAAGMLSLQEITLPQLLKKNNYQTYHIGKWHIGTLTKTEQKAKNVKEVDGSYAPTKRGYDQAIAASRWGAPRSYFDPYGNKPNQTKLGSKVVPITPRKKDEYLTDRLADEAVALLKKHHADKKNKRFFLSMSYYGVHTPIQAPQNRIAKFANKKPHNGQKDPTYAAMVSAVDDSVGRILKTLDTLGIANETLVIFSSDNGGRTKGNLTDNTPLRAGKASGYEGGIRVPWIIRWPGVIKPNTISKTPIITADIFPTIAAMVGANTQPCGQLDGVNLRPAFEGKPLKRDSLYWHFPHFRLHPEPYSIIREHEWKLIKTYYADGPKYALYDLTNDIGESKNLADKEPARRDRLIKKLEQHLKATGAKLPTPQKKEK